MVGGRYHCIMVRSFDHNRYYCCFMEGCSIYIGTASTLYCRRAIIIIIIIKFLTITIGGVRGAGSVQAHPEGGAGRDSGFPNKGA